MEQCAHNSAHLLLHGLRDRYCKGMLFSSLLFLWVFLPIVVLVTWLVPPTWRNGWLLVMSLLFYLWGGVGYIVILGQSIVLNYLIGRALKVFPDAAAYLLWLGIGLNLLLLGYFKYANWLVSNVNSVLIWGQFPTIELLPIALPIGISFYTFQAISYLVDVYRGTVKEQRSLPKLALYIALFPQLIAGPIVRYKELCVQLEERSLRYEQLVAGIRRFLIGLAKKVLLANEFALVADEIFALQASSLSSSAAWLGMIAYSLQIYYDFSGYSDMAIGIGRMLGFELPENFRFPYVARSIREFWHRWHISLSNWFRDYLYFPLGGSYGTQATTYRNLSMVFLATGLWHGAAWNFVLWGALHGFFLILERQRWWPQLPIWMGRLYCLLVVGFAWVLFRADHLQQAVYFYQALLGLKSAPTAIELSPYGNPRFIGTLVIGILGSVPFVRLQTWQQSEWGGYWQVGILLLLLSWCTMELVTNSYNPFIYFRF